VQSLIIQQQYSLCRFSVPFSRTGLTVLAYQLVQAIRRKLEAAGEPLSWTRLREILSVQQRITATFQQRDGRTLHVRKATVAEPALRRIYDALVLNASPGGIQKLTV